MSYRHQILGITLLIIIAMTGVTAPPIYAQNSQNSQTSPQYQQRANQLVALFDKKISYNDFFSPNFLEAVSTSQLDQIINGVKVQYGAPIRVQSITAYDRNAAIIKLKFERATATIEMVVNPSSPFKVSGLLLQGFEVIGDDYDDIEKEISSLPGKAGFAIHQLNDRNPSTLLRQYNGGEQFAIGSTFKLYILAELAAQIESGQRRWSDVAPLTPKSSTLGGTQNWPEGSLLTLQSLATLMISISDNNATDALIAFLGRKNIERRIRQIGHSDIDKITPFLSTAEAFSLKMRSNDKLREDFLKSSERQQEQIIARNADRLSINNYDSREFGGGPLYIDDIEWFAASADIAHIMNSLRLSPDPIIKNILAINSGVGLNDARKWNYLGYKGGSEPGVISLSFLVQSKTGQWYSVTGSWNNPKKEVNQNQWIAIMTRILNILAK